MRVGIVNINYECAATMIRAFDAWRLIKAGVLDLEVFIASLHVCFPETASLGFPVESSDRTIISLKNLYNQKIIDALCIEGESLEEQLAWSKALNALPSDIDYLLMLNSDECWEIEQVKKAFEFVTANPLVDYFKVNFKNYFGPKSYVDNFVVPRIWNMKRRGGVKRFYKDDLVEFNDGTYDTDCSSMVIPKRKVFPAHWSWSLPPECPPEQNEAFIKRKLGFQKLRYKNCSYKWDDNKGLILNEDYYKMIGQPMPEVFYE
jgi:hypothetical protein